MNSVEHYENFPVASWLCPPALRPPIAAIYHFARTADDIADEGHASGEERHRQLALYRQMLLMATEHPLGPLPDHPWPQVFGPLQRMMVLHDLPLAPLVHLLDAFEQDITYTEHGLVHADTASLMAYCTRSANPVGRLLLHLYGIHDPVSLAQSDAICSALQLANFWQDLSVDLARARYYLPADACAAAGLNPRLPPAPAQAEAAAQMLQQLVNHARRLMHDGAPLCRRIPGRAGWELRLVVQGGLRILDRVAQLGPQVWYTRPQLGKLDMARMLLRALRM